ncbi:hypothetical protein [uncultured Microbulbifer sp.]|uniref:hypothetical protein n=1 Tax=uncultured Microbulbifer sp. TaxID=348147 RepID=UPI002626175A|nr:hypothetical protein [uncultured Microbulbifer sp.]
MTFLGLLRFFFSMLLIAVSVQVVADDDLIPRLEQENQLEVAQKESVVFKQDLIQEGLFSNAYFVVLFSLVVIFLFFKFNGLKRRGELLKGNNIDLIEKKIIDNKLMAYLLVVDGKQTLIVQQPGSICVTLLSGEANLEVDSGA